MIEIKIGDCTQRLKDLEDNSVDAVICDPPYGIKVLEKTDWDNLGSGKQQSGWHRGWLAEVHRVLKPNGVLKAFSSAKTLHHLTSAMVETGFLNIKVEAWVYRGMPTGNYDIAKGIEATILFGNANSQTFKKLKGTRKEGKTGINKLRVVHGIRNTDYDLSSSAFDLEPQTNEGKRFMGYGTTLKKSWEPVCIGFKQ